MRWPWQRRVASGERQQRPRVVPPRRDWMGLAPLQRTVLGPTLTTAADGFPSRLASRSARPLVQPLTHGVMRDAPAGHLDGVTRPSAPAPPRVEPRVQPDLPLVGRRVVAQRATAGGRPTLTSAPKAGTPARRVRAVPPVQRQAAQPEAPPTAPDAGGASDDDAAELSLVEGSGTSDAAGDEEATAAEAIEPADAAAVAASGDRAEPSAPAPVPGGSAGASLVESSGSPIGAEAPTLAGPAGAPVIPSPPAGTADVARMPAGTGGQPSPVDVDLPLPEVPATAPGVPLPPADRGPAPAADQARLQRAVPGGTRSRPPRRIGLGDPLVSPVQRSAPAGTPASPQAPAAPADLPLPQGSTVPATGAAPPADTVPGDGGQEAHGADGGAAPAVVESDAPTIGERTALSSLTVERSVGSGDASPADARPFPVARPGTSGATEPAAAPADLPLQRAPADSAVGGSPGRSAAGPSGASTGGTARPEVAGAQGGAVPHGRGRGGTSEPALVLQRSRAAGSTGGQPTSVPAGSGGGAPAQPGGDTAPAGADASAHTADARVAVASPQLPPPLVPPPRPAQVSMPLLAQRTPLLQRVADAEGSAGLPPPPGRGGPPGGGVARATQMSTTVPRRRPGQGSPPRGAQAGRTVQPLRRVGTDATSASAAAPAPSAPATPSPSSGPRGNDAGKQKTIDPLHTGPAPATVHGAEHTGGGPDHGRPPVLTPAPTLTPAPPDRRGTVTGAVAGGVRRLIARASRSPGQQSGGGTARGTPPAAGTSPRADTPAGIDGGALVPLSRPIVADTTAGNGAVDLAMPQVQLRATQTGTPAVLPRLTPSQLAQPPAPVAPVAAPEPVVQRAVEPATVAEAPPPAAAPVAAAGAAAASGSPPQSEEDLDVLAGRLYEHIAGRLRHELRVDRERTGLLTDLQG